MSCRKSHRVRVQCRQCLKHINSDYIGRHMHAHRRVRPFGCAQCGKSFTTQSQCQAHEFRHRDERPLQCALCDKRFKLKCDMRIHMAVHNDERRYECDLCDKAFRMRSHLVDHRETHNTERTLRCDQCALMFKTAVTLRSHVRQMHAGQGGHAHRCEECGRGFFRRHKLQRHMEGHERKASKLGASARQKSSGVVLC